MSMPGGTSYEVKVIKLRHSHPKTLTSLTDTHDSDTHAAGATGSPTDASDAMVAEKANSAKSDNSAQVHLAPSECTEEVSVCRSENPEISTHTRTRTLPLSSRS